MHVTGYHQPDLRLARRMVRRRNRVRRLRLPVAGAVFCGIGIAAVAFLSDELPEPVLVAGLLGGVAFLSLLSFVIGDAQLVRLGTATVSENGPRVFTFTVEGMRVTSQAGDRLYPWSEIEAVKGIGGAWEFPVDGGEFIFIVPESIFTPEDAAVLRAALDARDRRVAD